MTKCAKCKEEKIDDSFSSDKKRKNGLRVWCKDCVQEYNREYNKKNKHKIAKNKKQYYNDNKDEIVKYKKQHTLKNKDRIAEKQKQYYDNNQEKILNDKKEYYLKNKDKIIKDKKQYRKDNKDEISERKKTYYKKNKNNIAEYRIKNKDKIARQQKERMESDINFKLASVLRGRLYLAIRNNQKTGSAVSDLGCTIPELNLWLEQQFLPGMTWENYGEWHIDHILPLSKFDLTDRKQLLKACNWFNLQPLWAADNIKKSNH